MCYKKSKMSFFILIGLKYNMVVPLSVYQIKYLTKQTYDKIW